MTWKVTKEDTQHQLLDLSLFLSPFLPPSTRAHVRSPRQSAGPHIYTRAHVRAHTDNLQVPTFARVHTCAHTQTFAQQALQ